MKRNSITVEKKLEEELQSLARISGKKVSEVLAQAIHAYARQNKHTKRYSFIAIGSSGQSNISQTYKDKLWNRT